MVLKSFEILKKAGYVDKLLVLAPLRVVTTSWPNQLDYWADFKHMTYSVIHGDRKEAMEQDVDVYLMNYEGLLSPEFCTTVQKRKMLSPAAVRWLKANRFMLAVDESTKMKNPAGQRFKVLKQMLPLTEYRTILTGTPKPNDLEDLFAQCYITDRGRDLGEFVTHFRRQYMVPSYSGYGFEPQPGANERVAAKIAPTTLQIEYQEAVPSQVIPIWVPMPEEAKAFYDELKKEFLAVLGDDIVIAPNTGALLNKLRQVAQGAVYRADKDEGWIEVHQAKLDALENLLVELNGEPAFCLTQYRHDVARISERLGAPQPYIGSGTSAQQGAAWCSAFSAGSLPLLLAHPLSAAHGIDGLQNNCKNVIWFGMDWSYENWYQANLRVVRSGSKADQVYIYQILVDCGVERAVLEAVKDKQQSEADLCRLLRQHLA